MNAKINISKEDLQTKLRELEKFPLIIEKMNQLLLKTGWFYDSKILQSEKIIELLVKNNLSTLDQLFIDFYSKKQKYIESKCINRFPHRDNIIKKAFRAYRKKDYDISIVLLLTQVDGMFRDLSTKDFFSKNKKFNPIEWIKRVEKDKNNSLMTAGLAPLKESEILAADFGEAKKYPNVINRNLILHGEDLKFGSKINSLKTISMINYISIVVYDIIVNNKILDF